MQSTKLFAKTCFNCNSSCWNNTILLMFRGCIRRFSVASVRTNRAPSSCAPGTVLNLKIKKNGAEPVALEDSEYPEWLWGLLDKKATEENLKKNDFMKWKKKKINRLNTEKINNNNFLATK